MAEKKQRGKGKRRATKDRVLQARIPEQLDDELRDRSEQLGLSVSTIVRNVLLNTFELVEGVVADSAQIARAIQSGESLLVPEHEASIGEAADSKPETKVIGWQEAVLNQNGICEQCNAILPKGGRAAVGMPVGPRPLLMCLDCLAALSSGSPQQAGAPQKEKVVARKKASTRSKKPTD